MILEITYTYDANVRCNNDVHHRELHQPCQEVRCEDIGVANSMDPQLSTGLATEDVLEDRANLRVFQAFQRRPRS